jgi:hypothetical protein
MRKDKTGKRGENDKLEVKTKMEKAKVKSTKKSIDLHIGGRQS